ncbi:MAG: DUF4190 domain-containing protein [Actinomycetota bacterium]
MFRWTAALGAFAIGLIVLANESWGRLYLSLEQTHDRPRNFWATQSLGFAILGVFLFAYGVPSVIAVAMGIHARRQIAQGNGGGKGMATAGIIIGAWEVLGVVVVVILKSFIHANWVNQL